ncbi:MAG TPA: PilT/PilU family type 4a pilus ATPase [Terriglobales bacterium]|nr:PilT/PilU family type 4a pilus ATPase [Terriglobales bacterium]
MDAPTLTPASLIASLTDSAPTTPAKPESPLPPPAAAPAKTAAPVAGAPVIVRTPTLIASMLSAAPNASDLIFSPGRAPQVDMHGGLIQLKIQGVGILTPEDTARIAADLIGRNTIALQKLKEQGSCDISYSLPKISRFRVNVFTQRGTCAIVMRVIPSATPDFKSLNLPEQLAETVDLRNGIVLVTGPTGSGKSSTLAAILNRINEEKAFHVITIEDPIEFLHGHKRATIHQRELHSDTPSFALALRAALRQAPKVILVGEMRDKETIEVALEAAETGHLVFSTLHTTDASKTIERIIGVFPLSDQNTIRNRLAKAFRYIVSQRLIPRLDGKGRVAAFEILKSTMRTRDYVEKGETEGKSLLDAMRDGETEGMQCFDGEIEKLIRANIIDLETGVSYSTNAGNLRLMIADLADGQRGENNFPSSVIKPVPLRDTEIEIER